MPSILPPEPAPQENDRVPDQNSVDAAGASRLKTAVEAAGGRSTISRRSKVPLGTLNKFLAGREMRRSHLVALAQACGVSLGWLATGEPPMHSRSSNSETVAAHSAHNSMHRQVVVEPSAAIVGYTTLPQYDVLAAAGHGALAGNVQFVGSILFEQDWIRTHLRRNPTTVVLIEARGDAMDPTIREGNMLLVDMSPDVRDGAGIYVIAEGDNLLVRRLHRKIGGAVVLTSDNPRYQPDTIPPAAAAQLRIVGQVVWQGHPVRS